MKKLDVLYQSSDAYAVITGVSMTSLLENSKDIDELNIYVLDNDITTDNKERMQQLCHTYGRSITMVDTGDILRRLKSLNVVPFNNSYATYFKLLAFQNLPISGDRILYLDSDTIIDGSLSELCTLDFGDSLMAATYDCTLNQYKSFIDIPATDPYYNAGVLLINRPKWIADKCEDQIEYHLKNVRCSYYTADQDILNVLFRKQVRYLDIRYNFNSGFFIYGIKGSLDLYGLRPPFYDRSEHIAEAMKKPVIYHCMGAMTGRPWENDSIHPQNELFSRYLSLSPWTDYRKINVQRSIVFRIQRQLFQILPLPIYMPFHKLAQKLYLSRMNKEVSR